MTSEPPRASSWATPPEFYLDENTVSRSVRHLLTGLGYFVHTPAGLFGSREVSSGAADEEWLERVTGRGRAVIGRDLKIYERPWELEAYPSGTRASVLAAGPGVSCAIGPSRRDQLDRHWRYHLQPEGRDLVPDRIRAGRVRRDR
jgi:hypothetical protein